MSTLTIQMPEELATRIQNEAANRGVTVDALMCQYSEEKLPKCKSFEEAMEHVLAKNAELYRRLAAN